MSSANLRQLTEAEKEAFRRIFRMVGTTPHVEAEPPVEPQPVRERTPSVERVPEPAPKRHIMPALRRGTVNDFARHLEIWGQYTNDALAKEVAQRQ